MHFSVLSVSPSNDADYRWRLTDGMTPERLSEKSGTGSDGSGSSVCRPLLSSTTGVALGLAIKPGHEL